MTTAPAWGDQIGMKLVVGGALSTMVFILAVLPLMLMLVPNPRAVKIADLSGERAGAFLGSGKDLFRLYPYASLKTGFPSDAIATPTRPLFKVKARALSGPERYGIRTYPDNRTIPSQIEVKTKKLLAITPATELIPGRYYLEAARDSMYGGADYFFFSVPDRDQAEVKAVKDGRK